jgi:hypothetical protein
VSTTPSSAIPPITINNVLPEHFAPATQMERVSSAEATVASHLDVSGLLDDAVEEYTSWQQSRVRDESRKAQYRKACDLTMEHLLVVVTGVDGIWERSVRELGEVHGVGIAVDEEDVFQIHGADGLFDPAVEVDEVDVVWVCGFVERVVPGHEGIPLVAFRDLAPYLNYAVLEFFELPKESPVYTGI